MTQPPPRTMEQVRADIESERKELADAVEHLTASVTRLRRRLPLVLAAAAAVVGLALVLSARRSRG